MPIKIATSQFPVSADIHKNKEIILAQMEQAKKLGADIIHFPEGSLSGYAGIDFQSFAGFNWEELLSASNEITQMSKKLSIWSVLGSAHRLEKHKPHNSVYVINNKGELVDRYDKMFCAGTDQEDSEELKHFSPGDHFTTFIINGITCGIAICHEYRYPEIYRRYKQKGVKIMFHSFHAGNMQASRLSDMENQVGEEFFAFNYGRTIPEITMPATMVSYAANNYLWISCSNSSAAESCWASFMVRPDGVVTGKLVKNQESILLTEADPEKEYYDSTKHWRDRAMNGIFHSGNLVDDRRSKHRNVF